MGTTMSKCAWGAEMRRLREIVRKNDRNRWRIWKSILNARAVMEEVKADLRKMSEEDTPNTINIEIEKTKPA